MNVDAVTYSIAGQLKSLYTEQAGRWEFVYAPSDETICLEVSIGQDKFRCEFGDSGIKELIDWLQTYHRFDARG